MNSELMFSLSKGSKKMKPFDLDRAKAGDPVVTRDGREVTEILFSKKANVTHPVLAFVAGTNRFTLYSKEGLYFESGVSDNDLFMAPKITRGWINIYKFICGNIYAGSKLHESPELASNYAKSYGNHLVETVCVEIEE